MLLCSIISIFGSILMMLSYYSASKNGFLMIFSCTLILSFNAFQFTTTYLASHKNVYKFISHASSIFTFIQLCSASFLGITTYFFDIENQMQLGLLIIIPFGLMFIWALHNIRVLPVSMFSQDILTIAILRFSNRRKHDEK